MRVPVRGPAGGQPQEPSISAARRARVPFPAARQRPLAGRSSRLRGSRSASFSMAGRCRAGPSASDSRDDSGRAARGRLRHTLTAARGLRMTTGAMDTVPVLHRANCIDTAMRPRGGPPSASIPCRSRLSSGSVLNWARQPKTVRPAKIPLSRFARRWSENGNHQTPANLGAAIQ
jgi:hypothetical protein